MTKAEYEDYLKRKHEGIKAEHARVHAQKAADEAAAAERRKALGITEVSEHYVP